MTLRPPPGAVITLDVDDTLYLERAYVRSGFDAVGRLLQARSGIDGIGATLWAGFLEGVRGDAFDRALSAHGVETTADLVAELIDHYRSHAPSIELEPDAANFITRTIERAGRLAVITDGPEASQQAKVTALGLDAVADPVVLTARLGPGRSKPHPAAYRTVETAAGAEPDRCWYIGDNPKKDFIAPLERGWTAVRIRRPESLHAELATPDDVVEIDSFDEIA